MDKEREIGNIDLHKNIFILSFKELFGNEFVGILCCMIATAVFEYIIKSTAVGASISAFLYEGFYLFGVFISVTTEWALSLVGPVFEKFGFSILPIWKARKKYKDAEEGKRKSLWYYVALAIGMWMFISTVDFVGHDFIYVIFMQLMMSIFPTWPAFIFSFASIVLVAASFALLIWASMQFLHHLSILSLNSPWGWTKLLLIRLLRPFYVRFEKFCEEREFKCQLFKRFYFWILDVLQRFLEGKNLFKSVDYYEVRIESLKDKQEVLSAFKELIRKYDLINVADIEYKDTYFPLQKFLWFGKLISKLNGWKLYLRFRERLSEETNKAQNSFQFVTVKSKIIKGKETGQINVAASRKRKYYLSVGEEKLKKVLERVSRFRRWFNFFSGKGRGGGKITTKRKVAWNPETILVALDEINGNFVFEIKVYPGNKHFFHEAINMILVDLTKGSRVTTDTKKEMFV